MQSRYAVVSGVLFGVIAVVQALRALYQWPVQVGDFDMPVWASWIALIVSGSMCIWAFRCDKK